MGVTTGLPSGTVTAPGFVVSGASTVHAALADALDTTFVTDTAAGTASKGHYFEVNIAPIALPAGAAIKRVTPRVRVSQAVGSALLMAKARYKTGAGVYAYESPYWAFQPNTTILTRTAASGGAVVGHIPGYSAATPQAVANALTVLVSANRDTPYTGSDDHRVYRVEVEIEYDEQPTVTGLAWDPADAPAHTTSPTLTWDYADPEQVPQQGYRAVVWSASAYADANCPDATAATFTDTAGVLRTAAAYSGTLSDPTVLGTSDRHTFEQLAQGSWVACVQVADKVGDVVRWSTAQGTLAFTLSITAPPAPTLSSLTWDATNRRAQLTAAWSGTLAGTLLAVERSSDAGVTWQPVPGYVTGVPIGASSSITVRDGSARHQVAVRYRARVLTDDGTWQAMSNWSATIGPVTPTITKWLLRDPADVVTAPVVLSIGGSLPMPEEEALGVFQPVGADFAVFVSSALRAGPWQMTVTVVGEAQLDALKALRRSRAVMVLQSDMAGLAWWVRFGASFTPTLLNSTARPSATTRPYQVEMTLHRSYGPDGQLAVP